ncbi:TetR/AcrR family transcriptional regulator [Streptomyces sp. SID14478]|uniref:TetR/AcrR family transcriptional regulator n=1 Tax=Streptomyces sp. SID14478 TaxID=2706073 RepID=UPI0013DE7C92|nr:TetR/AcrR family transcriptional regulator [Streptomyces sp. SID14478]NEB81005.1 TetR/AcrR family transcriptional regulator [Streptomyces sp. SID14478]
MSPRSASVNEELRRRSRERLLQATLELVGERGYDATTLGDIADRAGSARGLVSYYFPGKRHLLQSAVHRLMHRTLEETLERAPRTQDGNERLARAIDAILGLARDQPVLMRTHMAGILHAEGFVQCPEQQRLAELLRDTVTRHGTLDVDRDYPLLRAVLMGAVFAMLVPGVPMPMATMRAELFDRYDLEWEQGFPPGESDDASPDGSPAHGRPADFSRYFEPLRPAPDTAGRPARTDQTDQTDRMDRTDRSGQSK